MTDRGYDERIDCLEWHMNLWRLHGVPESLCWSVMTYCTEVIGADRYGFERPDPEGDPIAREWSLRMRDYLDRIFNSPYAGPVSFA